MITTKKHVLVIGATLIIVLFAGVFRITDTHGVFSQTFDEASHLAAGMQLIDRSQYTYDPLHPPLGRLAIAALPYLTGSRSFGQDSYWDEGHTILYAQGVEGYVHVLSLSRLGVIPFFIIATIATYFIGSRIFGSGSGILAAIIFSTTPLIIAHSSVATTDMAFCATYLLFVLTLLRWLDDRTYLNAGLVCISAGVTIGAKMSALVFAPLTFLIVMILYRFGATQNYALPWRSLRAAILSAAVSCSLIFFVVWAIYGFSTGQISSSMPSAPPYRIIDRLIGTSGWLHGVLYGMLEWPIPAPEFFSGIAKMIQRNTYAGYSYFLGEHRIGQGFGLFFPVGLLVKMTVPSILLVIIGSTFALQRQLRASAPWALLPFLIVLVTMFVLIPAKINIGIRHVIHVIPFLAMIAGFGVLWLLKIKRFAGMSKVLGLGLLIWHLFAGVYAHPDYLAYFNILARGRDNAILLDSDLDWGQDVKRLADEVINLKIDKLSYCLNGSKRYLRRRVRDDKVETRTVLSPLKPYTRVNGWIAISYSCLRAGTREPPFDQHAWLASEKPYLRVGKSILMYRID